MIKRAGFKILISTLPFVFFFVISAIQSSCAKAEFVNIEYRQENNNMPVILSENEIFFPGEYRKNIKFDLKARKKQIKTEIIPARIYDIKTKKIKNLNSYMKVPRNGYGAIKYDDENILVLGGHCIDYANNRINCDNIVVENYNINQNNFTRLNNMPLPYRPFYNTLFKINNEIFIISNNGIMNYNAKSNSIIKLLDFDLSFRLASYNACQIDSNNILIWGEQIIKPLSYKQKNVILKYNILNNEITELYSDLLSSHETNVQIPGIPLKNGKILFIKKAQKGSISYEFDAITKKFLNYKNIDLDAIGVSGIYLENNKILLTYGCLNKGLEPFIRGIYLNQAILDLDIKKITNKKTTRNDMWHRYILPFGINKYFIGNYSKDTKSKLFYYN